MYCPKCGAKNDDQATSCVICRATLPAPPPKPAPGDAAAAPPGMAAGPGAPVLTPSGPQQVPNYLVQAILVTLFCCLPAGIAGIVYAAQVSSKLQAGDVDGAMRASKNAKTWTIVSFAVGLGVGVLYLVVGLAAAIADSM